MPTIILRTIINSDLDTCFDLSRSIDLHQISTKHTKEQAIGGVTKGLIGLGEWVTWQAVHFGVKQKLTSKITKFSKPNHFRDEQQKGPFKFIIHDHYFELQGASVLMTDIFNFKSPFSILGFIADKFFLTAYLTKLLKFRNAVIKNYAESGKGTKLINE